MSATTDKAIEVMNEQYERGVAFVERCRKAIIRGKPFEYAGREIDLETAVNVAFVFEKNDDKEFYTQLPEDIIDASNRIVRNVYPKKQDSHIHTYNAYDEDGNLICSHCEQDEHE